jgi:hypothetical protein
MVSASNLRRLCAMYTRVVRFTDVSPEDVERSLAQIQDSDGPPPGAAMTRLQMLYDADQATAVVVQHFESAQDMEAADRVLGAMDPSDTPGTRVSVDACEVKLDMTA